MITVKGVTKRYDSFTAIDGLSCEAGENSIYGIVGANGAGKTTLLKTIAGIYKPDAGSVLIDGEDIFENVAKKRRLFFMPDDFYFFGTASLKAMASLYRGFYPNWSQKTFTKLTELFELDSTKRISSFSKGMQRQASIILAMSTRPKYLLLDEAFDGLDPVKRNLLRRILLEYITTDGISLIISSHNLRELEDLCDHVGVIRDKKVVFESGIDDMRANMNKYRVVFASDFNTDELKDFGLKGLIQDGKIITFIASGSTLELENKLKQFNPLLVESLPMTLEEIFLGETEAKDYDFGEIFGA